MGESEQLPTEADAASGSSDLAIQPSLEEILQDIPEETRELVITKLETMESHSGWLPSPRVLRQYDEMLPGLAERIVALPEREQAHRHKVIETALQKDSTLKLRGQSFALISLGVLVAFAFYLAWLGNVEWAAKVAIFGIVGVVGIFVTGKVADLSLAKQVAADEESDD